MLLDSPHLPLSLPSRNDAGGLAYHLLPCVPGDWRASEDLFSHDAASEANSSPCSALGISSAIVLPAGAQVISTSGMV